jgi:hypothetical protein
MKMEIGKSYRIEYQGDAIDVKCIGICVGGVPIVSQRDGLDFKIIADYHIIESHDKEEPSFKRGDRVLVRDREGQPWTERTLACDYDGITAICVVQGDESEFKKGVFYRVSCWYEIKSMPQKIDVSQEAYDLMTQENKSEIFKVA